MICRNSTGHLKHGPCSETFAMTTNEYGYSERQNLIRLQKAIKGKAREVVECLLIHSRNVPDIMDALKQNFGRPEKLIKSQIARVRKSPVIKEGMLPELLDYRNKVQNLTSFLEAADGDRYLENPTLMEELVSKLPPQQRLEWARYRRDCKSHENIKDFSKWLQGMAEDIQAAGLNDETDATKSKNQKSRFLHANEVEDKEKGGVVCKGRHNLEKCEQFVKLGIDMKWKAVRDNKLCFNCLRAGHRVVECKFKHKCETDGCTKKINKLLHKPTEVTTFDSSQGFSGTASQANGSTVLFKILTG
ncbi:hypothetical protein ACLKA6_010203 [Drosophila palustris]